jgi:hypothetical protein
MSEEVVFDSPSPALASKGNQREYILWRECMDVRAFLVLYITINPLLSLQSRQLLCLLPSSLSPWNFVCLLIISSRPPVLINCNNSFSATQLRERLAQKDEGKWKLMADIDRLRSTLEEKNKYVSSLLLSFFFAMPLLSFFAKKPYSECDFFIHGPVPRPLQRREASMGEKSQLGE